MRGPGPKSLKPKGRNRHRPKPKVGEDPRRPRKGIMIQTPTEQKMGASIPDVPDGVVGTEGKDRGEDKDDFPVDGTEPEPEPKKKKRHQR